MPEIASERLLFVSEDTYPGRERLRLVKLFKAMIQNPNHVLRKLLPEVRQTNYDLRPMAYKCKLISS